MLSFGATAPSLSSRLTSLGLVGGLHLLIVAGLAAGLMRERQAPPPEPPKLDILKDRLPEPEPLKPLVREDIQLPTPVVPVVMPKPEHWNETPPAPTISAVVADMVPVQTLETPRPVAVVPPQPTPASAVQSAGMLCPTQTQPQIPALATAGSAQLRVIGTVRGGRVVNVQTQTLHALPERRAQRALLLEVERVLREGYSCTQDGVFEQEFLFRVE